MKSYKQWHSIKSIINDTQHIKHFREREVFYVSLGKNIGHEQDGKGQEYLRPVIILKKFNKRLFLAIPVTSQVKEGKHYFQFQLKNIQNYAILSQIRLLDAQRLKYKIGKLNVTEFQELRKQLIKLI